MPRELSAVPLAAGIASADRGRRPEVEVVDLGSVPDRLPYFSGNAISEADWRDRIALRQRQIADRMVRLTAVGMLENKVVVISGWARIGDNPGPPMRQQGRRSGSGGTDRRPVGRRRHQGQVTRAQGVGGGHGHHRRRSSRQPPRADPGELRPGGCTHQQRVSGCPR